jgi:hypothetical protein
LKKLLLIIFLTFAIFLFITGSSFALTFERKISLFPETVTMILFGIGLIGLSGFCRKRFPKNSKA